MVQPSKNILTINKNKSQVREACAQNPQNLEKGSSWGLPREKYDDRDIL